MTILKKFAWYGSSVAFATVLALALLVTGPMGTATAAVPTLSPTSEAPADNLSTVTITATYWEGTDGDDATIAAIASGDVCTFSVGGTGATFANGSASYTYVTSTTSCVAKLKTTTAGTYSVAITGTDVSTGRGEVADDGGDGTTNAATSVVFYGVPSATDADTLFAVGSGTVKNITTAEVVADGEAVTFHIEDAGDREVAGAPYTLTVTGGATFSATGTATTSGLTSAAGEIGTATNLTVPSGAFSGTITLEIAAKTGTITMSGPVVKAGAAQTYTFAVDAADKDADGNVATSVGAADTAVAKLTVKDSAGTKVDPVGAVTISCTGLDSASATLLTSSTVAAFGSDGVTEISVDPAASTLGGIVTCTWTAAAVTGTNAEPGATGTFTVVVARITISSVKVTMNATVNPGIPVSVVVDLLDANGNRVQTGVPADTVTVAVNGTTGGNLIVGGSAIAHTNGRVTSTFVPGDTLGNFTITAITSNAAPKSGFAVVAVEKAGTTPPAAGDGTFASEPAESGVSIVVFNGGTVAQLAETAAGLDVLSVSATVDGAFVVYIVGAPAFVNSAFNAAFPDGLAAGTAVILKK